MATAEALAEDLTCAVCLHIYRDPVILPCQHSFCLECINNVWAGSILSVEVSCPQCRRKFSPRPSLDKNFTLGSIVEKYNLSQSAEGESAPVMCEYCFENPSPAVKTCLKCETSFCSLHLKPHLAKKTYNDHTLIEPVADLTKRLCTDHKKILEFYCETDEKCVCISCTVIGTHKSHTLLSLDQAEAKIKDKLKKNVKNLHRIQEDCSTEMQGLKTSEDEIKTISNELKEKLSKKFSEWRKWLEEDEENVLKLIDEEECRVLSEIRSNSETLTNKMEKIRIIHAELQNQPQMDSLSFIQDSKQLLSRFLQFEDTMEPQDIYPAPGALNTTVSQYISAESNVFQHHWKATLSDFCIQPQARMVDQCTQATMAPKNNPTTAPFILNKAGYKNYAQFQPASRATVTQNFTLKLHSIHQLIRQQVQRSQVYQSDMLKILNNYPYQ
ncbi:E3 ubiquitin/ISG15 ligase TRIM25-like [Carcharodon carcharias]|uniref:E3 ubiquitin/ISG15 ligase TRIM25-like n=1 Tax=Carcharodon carcharias TaxID=13397 RepID=UPI001B7EE064|nr:E3 ubiquitin/ISG15 ligase TRIM25-like [Carcharodon carcharias]